MSVCSFPFLFFVGVAAVAFSLFRGAAARRILLILANAAFLIPFVGSWRSAGVLAAFLIAGYVSVRLASRNGNRFPAVIPIAPSVAFLVYAKRYAFLHWLLPDRALAHGIEIVGLSYMTFKLIHMVVDARDQALAPVGLASYANYQLGFFTLLAGPIQRYNDFEAYWRAPDAAGMDWRETLLAWNRLLTGIIKTGLLGSAAFALYGRASSTAFVSTGMKPAACVLVAAYASAFYVYFNFSGYCDIVIAAARLLGVTLPENFDYPFLARNMIDFWNRWHVTLTHWVRDYVFMTSYKWIGERWESLRAAAGYVLLFLALFLAGLWHGSTGNFVIFALLHGSGVLATEVYTDAIRWVFGPRGLKRYQQNRWARWVATVVTFHYVCFAFLFFHADWRRTIAMLHTAFLAMGGMR